MEERYTRYQAQAPHASSPVGHLGQILSGIDSERAFGFIDRHKPTLAGAVDLIISIYLSSDSKSWQSRPETDQSTPPCRQAPPPSIRSLRLRRIHPQSLPSHLVEERPQQAVPVECFRITIRPRKSGRKLRHPRHLYPRVWPSGLPLSFVPPVVRDSTLPRRPPSLSARITSDGGSTTANASPASLVGRESPAPSAAVAAIVAAEAHFPPTLLARRTNTVIAELRIIPVDPDPRATAVDLAVVDPRKLSRHR